MPVQIAYIPHGGGPLPLLGEPGHAALTSFLSGFAKTRPRPSSILVISAHYEAETPTVTGAPHPELVFDYYGFPAETYRYTYAPPGAPALARTIQTALRTAGFDARIDPERGLDHGAFAPLMLMQPAADIPVLQLSLDASLDAEAHLRMGEALAALGEEDVLVLGSGMSFHNMAALVPAMRGTGAAQPDAGADFQDWLVETLTAPALAPAERRARLAEWASAPGGRFSHPREEHLLPLHVCAGLAHALEARAEIAFDADVISHRVLGVEWRAAA